MKRHYLTVILFISLCQAGCAFLGGAAIGSLATGAGYEINAKRQMDNLESDYRNERISRREYESRKRQIESGSIVY
jgi:hypothetical protein